MAKKRIAASVIIEVDENDDGTYVQVGCLQSVNIPARSKDQTDMTCLEDTIDDQRPSTVITLGQATFTLFRDLADSTHAKLEQIFARTENDSPGPILPWKISMPLNGNTWEVKFKAWIQELGEIPLEVKTEVIQEVTLEVTTLPTYTQATP